jgi:hypothetical protein
VCMSPNWKFYYVIFLSSLVRCHVCWWVRVSCFELLSANSVLDNEICLINIQIMGFNSFKFLLNEILKKIDLKNNLKIDYNKMHQFFFEL